MSNGQFAHRPNKDGYFDSICRKCGVTAVRCGRLKLFAALEKSHVCDGPLLITGLPKRTEQPATAKLPQLPGRNLLPSIEAPQKD
jgi:hypothetical protein